MVYIACNGPSSFQHSLPSSGTHLVMCHSACIFMEAIARRICDATTSFPIPRTTYLMPLTTNIKQFTQIIIIQHFIPSSEAKDHTLNQENRIIFLLYEYKLQLVHIYKLCNPFNTGADRKTLQGAKHNFKILKSQRTFFR